MGTSLDTSENDFSDNRRGRSRWIVGAVSLVLVPVWCVWFLLAYVVHSFLANEVCFDTGPCRDPRHEAAVIADILNGLGLFALTLAIVFGLFYSTRGRHFTAFAWSSVVAASAIISWIALIIAL